MEIICVGLQHDGLDKLFFPSAVRNFHQMTDTQQTRNKLFIIKCFTMTYSVLRYVLYNMYGMFFKAQNNNKEFIVNFWHHSNFSTHPWPTRKLNIKDYWSRKKMFSVSGDILKGQNPAPWLPCTWRGCRPPLAAPASRSGQSSAGSPAPACC